MIFIVTKLAGAIVLMFCGRILFLSLEVAKELIFLCAFILNRLLLGDFCNNQMLSLTNDNTITGRF